MGKLAAALLLALSTQAEAQRMEAVSVYRVVRAPPGQSDIDHVWIESLDLRRPQRGERFALVDMQGRHAAAVVERTEPAVDPECGATAYAVLRVTSPRPGDELLEFVAVGPLPLGAPSPSLALAMQAAIVDLDGDGRGDVASLTIDGTCSNSRLFWFRPVVCGQQLRRESAGWRVVEERERPFCF